MSNDRGISVICGILCNSRPPVMDSMTPMNFFVLFKFYFIPNTHTDGNTILKNNKFHVQQSQAQIEINLMLT